jgi:HTH-type transcriptional regulator/antitoxin HigA
MTGFVPAVVFPPGTLIQEELEARGWTQADLAEVMGRPVQAINEIVKAKKRVTEETAKELELALGIDAEIWLRNEALYRLHHAEPASTRISKRAALRHRVPLRQMIARGFIEPSDDEGELERRVLAFLGVESLEERPGLAMAAKQTVYGEQLTETQEVWLLRVLQLARTQTVARYSDEKLEAALEQFYPLLRSPDEARHVPRLLNEAGVRFVIVEQLPGLKTDAICTWLGPNEPVIGMSLVRDRIDNFWFAVVHECDHVINGEGKDGAIFDNDFDSQPDINEQERRANAVAADFCVPQHLMEDWMIRKGPLFSDEDLRDFARLHGRHPGLVAGQLRMRLHRAGDVKAWSKYTKHLARIRHVLLTTAMHDGFGITPEVKNS